MAAGEIDRFSIVNRHLPIVIRDYAYLGLLTTVSVPDELPGASVAPEARLTEPTMPLPPSAPPPPTVTSAAERMPFTFRVPPRTATVPEKSGQSAVRPA